MMIECIHGYAQGALPLWASRHRPKRVLQVPQLLSRRPVSCDFGPSRCQLSATNARWMLRVEPTTLRAEVSNYPFHLRSTPVSLSSVGSALIGNAEGGRDGKRRCPQQISVAVIARRHRVV
jgi:hypothetical protein